MGEIQLANEHKKSGVWNHSFKTNTEYQKQGIHNGFNMALTAMAFSKMPDDKDPIMLGWELETSFNKITNIAFIKKHANSDNYGDKLNFRRDGSDTEIVSIPATLNYHRSYMMDDFFKDLSYHPSSGLHVHIERKAFDYNTLMKFVGFINLEVNRKFINELAGRPIQDTQWCRPNVLNIKYAGPIRRFSAIRKIELPHINKTTLRVSGGNVSHTRYVAVNCTNDKGTIEVRMFTSRVTPQEFWQSLEFCESLVRYCRKARVNQLSVKHYLRWLENKDNRYPHILAFTTKYIKQNKAFAAKDKRKA